MRGSSERPLVRSWAVEEEEEVWGLCLAVYEEVEEEEEEEGEDVGVDEDEEELGVFDEELEEYVEDFAGVDALL